MNDNQLKSFLAAAKLGTFSSAARELHVAVPSFSQQIKTLERELGFPLFARSKHGVILTEQGRIMHAAVKEADELISAARKEALELGREKKTTLTIACDTTGHPTKFQMDIVESCRMGMPETSINFVPVPYEKLFESIRSGLIDVCLFTPPDEEHDGDLCFRPLYKDRILCCVSPSDPLAVHETISSDDLTGHTVYVEEVATHMSQMTPFFKGHNLTLNVEPLSVAQLLNAQCSNLAIFIPESYRSSCCPPLVGIPLAWCEIQHGITYKTNPSRAVKDFLNIAAAYFANLPTDSEQCPTAEQ